MDIYILLRPLIALAVWIAVGVLIIPEARRSKRSALLWYVVAMLAFMLTSALAFGFIGAAVHPLAQTVDAGQSRVIAMYIIGALIGIGLGFFVVFKIRGYLRKNPKSA